MDKIAPKKGPVDSAENQNNFHLLCGILFIAQTYPLRQNGKTKIVFFLKTILTVKEMDLINPNICPVFWSSGRGWER